MDAQQESTPNQLYPPKRRWRRDIFLGLTLFLCGTLVGGVVTTKVIINRATTFRQQGPDAKRAIPRLERFLDLSPEQATQVHQIIGEGMRELRQLREGVRPQVDETLKRVRKDVEALLDEKQKAKWDKHFEIMRNRWFPPPVKRDFPKRNRPVR